VHASLVYAVFPIAGRSKSLPIPLTPQSTRILRIGLATVLALCCALRAYPQSTDLTGIAHVALRVNDLQKSREFYHTLGFEQAFEFTDAGKTSVAYIKVNDRQFIELIPRTDDSQPGGILHICFETADIESLHKAYLERGLQPTDVQKGRAGNILFSIRGPDGQVLEYTQYLPGSLHSLDHGKHLGEHRVSDHLFEATAPVRDIAAERAFYTNKLAFKEVSPLGIDKIDGPELSIAGNSGDRVALQVGTPAAKPRIVFAVTSTRQAATQSRSRGFKVQKEHHTISITDPDGTVIVFARRRGP
jgi:catechol 2,3-dioxygenase-like lactoylglutathione lyase family enzyme